MACFSYKCTTTSTKGISPVFDNVPHQSAPPPPQITTTPPPFTPTFVSHPQAFSLPVLTVMSALSRQSPAKRKNPDNQEWCMVGASRRPQTVSNPEWACTIHAVCSGFIATRLRNDGKTHLGHCDQQIRKDASTCQVSCSIFKKSQGQPHPCLMCGEDVGGTTSLGRQCREEDGSQGKLHTMHSRSCFVHCFVVIFCVLYHNHVYLFFMRYVQNMTCFDR